MGKVDASLVKELRDRTGAGVMDCKEALQESDLDMDKAVEYLRKKGIAEAEKKSDRSTLQGVVHAYIHGDGKIGVLLEVNCETDFVAKSDEFQELVHNIAMQIAASDPQYVSREDVPEEVVAKEREILKNQPDAEGKPEHIVEQIVDGRLEKFYSRVCLLDQEYIRDSDMTVEDYVKSKIAQTGENISVRRFTRYEMGAGFEEEEQDLGSEVEDLLSQQGEDEKE